MKIFSYNIRGVGGSVKKQELRWHIGMFCPDFVCIQETKSCDHSNFKPYSVWDGGVIVWWVALDAIEGHFKFVE